MADTPRKRRSYPVSLLRTAGRSAAFIGGATLGAAGARKIINDPIGSARAVRRGARFVGKKVLQAGQYARYQAKYDVGDAARAAGAGLRGLSPRARLALGGAALAAGGGYAAYRAFRNRQQGQRLLAAPSSKAGGGGASAG
jgi:hypothetical protein